MGYAAKILPLKKVIEWTEAIKNKAIERCMENMKDEDLQEYRDYQFSLDFYLRQLKENP